MKRFVFFFNTSSNQPLGTSQFLLDQNKKYLKDKDGNFLITPGTRGLTDQRGRFLKDQEGRFLIY